MDENRTAVVVDSDEEIRDLIAIILKQSGFEVHAAPDGPSGVEAARCREPSLVTLGLSLPGFDGLETARRIRQFSYAVIMMITASGDESDILLALDAGADDYIITPFRPRELRARVEARMRRISDHQTMAVAAGSLVPAGMPPAVGMVAGTSVQTIGVETLTAGILEHEGLVLDTYSRRVQVDDRAVELTRSEFDLLQCLLESGPAVRTKAELIRQLRQDQGGSHYISDTDERTLEVHMTNLRRKLGDDALAPRWLRTVRGIGYALA